jgi:hypothetical protein
MDGELVRDGESYVLRFERVLPHPIDRVWQAITEPAGLAAWFPHSVELELRVGGKVVFITDPDFDVDPELLASRVRDGVTTTTGTPRHTAKPAWSAMKAAAPCCVSSA